jgi:protein ImuB
VDRLACVNVPDVALQIMRARHPERRAQPTVVLAGEGPRAVITSADGFAAALGIVVGMRYAEGLSIAPQLNAGMVSAAEVDAVVAAAAGALQKYSPEVEPSADEPGVFWMNASGLAGLFPSHRHWAEAVRNALARMSLRATVAVGFSKFGTYAAAALGGDVRVFQTPLEEYHAALQVPLTNLRVPDEVQGVLSKLGVLSVEALLRLPRDGALERLGREAHRLRQFAAGELWAPLRFRPDRDPPLITLGLDAGEENIERLLFLIKGRLPALLSGLAERGEALTALDVQLKPEGQHSRLEMHIRPAAPTMDEVQLLELLRLKLESQPLPGRVEEIVLRAHGVPWGADPIRLFPEHPHRDLAAGRRALARLGAALGEGAVVRARLKEGHLPEARFAWEPVDQIVLPKPLAGAPHVLVRRIWARPLPLPLGARPDPDGRIAGTGISPHPDDRIAGMGGSPDPGGPLSGPYVISGGWWRKEVHREYYFASTPRGEVLWIYYDSVRRRWFLHGRVE